jgi:hypothetical protein
MASLICPENSEVKWHNFAAKSLLLSPKAQVYGAKSSAGGRVSFQIQIADAKKKPSKSVLGTKSGSSAREKMLGNFGLCALIK